MADLTFEQIKSLVEQMPSSELERLREWLNKSADSTAIQQRDRTWGERIVELVNQFELDEVDLIDGADPEAWVREHRRSQTRQRNPNWGAE